LVLTTVANIGGDKAKKLLGEGEDYYRALQWISLSDCNAMPWAFRTCRMLGVFQGINLPYDKKTVDSNVKELDKLASMFETRLKTHTYLVTERPTISDFMAVYILSSAFKFIFGTNFRTAHPHFTRWFKTVSQHPFFEGAFDNFEYPDEMVNKN
jgi:elongation factor 1-gamma